MVAEGARLRQKVFEGRFVVLFEVRSRLVAGIQIILKVAAEVDLVERIFFLALGLGGNLFRAALAIPLNPRSLLERRRGFLEFLQYGILDHLRVDHVLQLKLVEHKHTDHLHQARRQYLPLRDLQIEFRL
jgi:hypothetical protein